MWTLMCVCVCLPLFVTLFPLLPPWSFCCVYVPVNGSATGRDFPYQWLCEHIQTGAHTVQRVSSHNQQKTWGQVRAAWEFSLAWECLWKKVFVHLTCTLDSRCVQPAFFPPVCSTLYCKIKTFAHVSRRLEVPHLSFLLISPGFSECSEHLYLA